MKRAYFNEFQKQLENLEKLGANDLAMEIPPGASRLKFFI